MTPRDATEGALATEEAGPARHLSFTGPSTPWGDSQSEPIAYLKAEPSVQAGSPSTIQDVYGMIGSATTFLKSQVNVFREFEHRGQSNCRADHYRLDLHRASSIPIRRLHHSSSCITPDKVVQHSQVTFQRSSRPTTEGRGHQITEDSIRPQR